MRALVKRELLLAKTIRKTIFAICCGGPMAIYLIPYFRKLRNLASYNENTLTLIGMIGVASYLVFYVLYETLKSERMDKSLEKAYAFWGIKNVLCVKALVAYGHGLICVCLFVLIFTLLNRGQFQISAIHLLLLVVFLAVFAWDSSIILGISDNYMVTLSIALIPGLLIGVVLLDNIGMYMVTMIFGIILGSVFQHIVVNKITNSMGERP